jgi:hypothetical protein
LSNIIYNYGLPPSHKSFLSLSIAAAVHLVFSSSTKKRIDQKHKNSKIIKVVVFHLTDYGPIKHIDDNNTRTDKRKKDLPRLKISSSKKYNIQHSDNQERKKRISK